MVHLPSKIQLHSCGWVGFPVAKKDCKNLANQAPCFPGHPWFTSTAFQALKTHLGAHHLGPWGIWSCQKPLRRDRWFSIKRWFRIGIPSGKHIQTNYGTSPYFNGWIHYFYGHFQVRKLLVIDREYGADMPLPRSCGAIISPVLAMFDGTGIQSIFFNNSIFTITGWDIIYGYDMIWCRDMDNGDIIGTYIYIYTYIIYIYIYSSKILPISQGCSYSMPK